MPKARVNFMNLPRSYEWINKAWIREGTIFLEWKDNESIEKIHGLYEGAELVQNSYETVIKCFETKLTNRTNQAYESENRREKLHNERPEQQNSNFENFNNFKNRNHSYKKQSYYPHMQFYPDYPTPYYPTNSFGFQNPRF